MKKYILLICWSCFGLNNVVDAQNADNNLLQKVEIDNGSFETFGSSQMNFIPTPWEWCNTADTHENGKAGNLLGSDGKYFVGIYLGTKSDHVETISQCVGFTNGEEYNLGFDVRPRISTGQDETPTNLQVEVWLGNENCAKAQMVFKSENITDEMDFWTSLEFNFTPDQDYTHISITGDPNDEASTSYFFLDNIRSNGKKKGRKKSAACESSPIAMFEANIQQVCPGAFIQLTDKSIHKPFKWEWIFEGGIPGSSKMQSPKVKYNKTGEYKVTLKVTNDFGTDTRILNNYIVVSADSCPVPQAAFSVNKQNVCAGHEVLFTDLSTLDPVTWEWSFVEGTPESSKEQNPTIVYNEPGVYRVTLSATNAFGTNTVTKNEFITVMNTQSLSVAEDFESNFPNKDWVISNVDSNYTWELSKDVGLDSKTSLVVKNSVYSTVGEIDELILPPLDFSGNNEVVLDFYTAYTRFDTESEDILEVLASNDCGKTWESLYKKMQTELETKEVDFDESQDWVPLIKSDWRKESVNLAEYKNNKSVTLKFRNTTGYGCNIWIDNINIDYVLNIKELNPDAALKLYPNPSNGTVNIDLSLPKMKT